MRSIPTVVDFPSKIVDGACPLARTTVFTAPSRTTLLAIDVANPTAGGQTVTVWINGLVLFSVVMPTLGGVSWCGPQVIELKQLVEIQCSSATCNFHISGSIS